MVCCRERPAWWGALVKVDIPFKYSAQVATESAKAYDMLLSEVTYMAFRSDNSTKLPIVPRFKSTFSFLCPNMNPYPFHAPRFPVPFFDNDIEKKRNCLKKGGSVKVRFCGRKRGSLFFTSSAFTDGGNGLTSSFRQRTPKHHRRGVCQDPLERRSARCGSRRTWRCLHPPS